MCLRLILAVWDNVVSSRQTDVKLEIEHFVVNVACDYADPDACATLSNKDYSE